VKARKTKRDASRAVLVRCCRQVTNRGDMQRLLIQFTGNLIAAKKQSRDRAAAVLEEAEERLRDATNKGVLATPTAAIELRSALESWKSSALYGHRKEAADERVVIQIQERNGKKNRKQKKRDKTSLRMAPSAPRMKISSDRVQACSGAPSLQELQTRSQLAAQNRAALDEDRAEGTKSPRTTDGLTTMAETPAQVETLLRMHAAGEEEIAGQQQQKKKRKKEKKKAQNTTHDTGQRMAPAAPQQEVPRLRLRRSRDTIVKWEHWVKTGGG
jgi:hypothetical protein